MENKFVNILGTDYEIIMDATGNNPSLKKVNGYAEFYAKQLVVDDYEQTSDTVLLPEKHKAECVRHEIVHAFLFESGLNCNSPWARNEEIVDWIALQIPKMYNAMKEAGAI